MKTKISIIALVWMLASLDGYAQELGDYVDSYDVCVAFVDDPETAKALQDSIPVFTVDSTKREFDTILKFNQPLGFGSGQEPEYQADCPNPVNLLLGDFQATDQDSEYVLIRNSSFALGSGYWSIQVRANKSLRNSSFYSEAHFIKVAYDIDSLAPRVPVIIYFKVVE